MYLTGLADGGGVMSSTSAEKMRPPGRAVGCFPFCSSFLVRVCVRLLCVGAPCFCFFHSRPDRRVPSSCTCGGMRPLYVSLSAYDAGEKARSRQGFVVLVRVPRTPPRCAWRCVCMRVCCDLNLAGHTSLHHLKVLVGRVNRGPDR